jgi:hypothetical protein
MPMFKMANKIENRFQAMSDYLDTWEAIIESWQGKSSFVGVIVGPAIIAGLAFTSLISVVGCIYAN